MPTGPQAEHDGQRESKVLGESLGPALLEACQGRLSGIEWFRSTWQRGQAATGFATWRFDDGRQVDAMVKLPVGPVEYRWTTRLGAIDHDQWDSDEALRLPTPRVLASGEELGGYDLAWFVVERLAGHPYSAALSGPRVEALLRAAAMLHARASAIMPPRKVAASPDWDRLLDKARQTVKDSAMPDRQRWNRAIKRLQKLLPELDRKWRDRACNAWCHGDLHPANAMDRAGLDPARAGCVLIDLALVHEGHWVEDAVYLERLYWGRNDLLGGVQPVAALAKYRRELGLDNGSEARELADVRRALLAGCSPGMVSRVGHPAQLRHALELLEGILGRWGR